MKSIALVLFGDSNLTRNALVDDNFKGFADSFKLCEPYYQRIESTVNKLRILNRRGFI
jgi:hypothetical protein